MSGPDISRLVSGVRGRLWLAKLWHLWARALWVSALVLAVGGLFRWRLAVPLIPLLVVLALLPLLYALIRSLLDRPTAADAARSADRMANADALLLSAWEAATSPIAPPGAASVVIARAAYALPEWERRLASGRIGESPARLWLPLTLCLATLPLLSLEGTAGPTSRNQVDLPAGPAREPKPKPGLAAVVEDLRLAAAEPPARRGETSTEGVEPGALGSAARDPMQANTRRPDHDASPSEPQGPRSANVPAGAPAGVPAFEQTPASGGGPGTGSGDGTGTEAAPPAVAERPQAHPELLVERIDIERRGAPRASLEGSGNDLIPSTETLERAAATAPAPAEVPSGIAGAGAEPDPALRVLISRYLQQVQKGSP